MSTLELENANAAGFTEAWHEAQAELATLRTQVDTVYAEAWDLAHSPAKCGHARANWKDPKYGTPEYQGDERCEVCALIAESYAGGKAEMADLVERMRADQQKFDAVIRVLGMEDT